MKLLLLAAVTLALVVLYRRSRRDPVPATLWPHPSHDLDGLPWCPTGYAQRYHAIGECDCVPPADPYPWRVLGGVG